MEINVAQLLKEPTGSTRELHIDELVCFERNAHCHHIQGNVKLIRIAKGILARGSFDSESQLTCGRCLSTFSYPFSFDVDDEFYPEVDLITGESISQPEDSTTFTIDEHNILDLREVFRQCTLLSMPMKPLCHPECLGLCPHCGTDLNCATCDCSSRPNTKLAATLENLKSSRKMG